MNNGDTQKSAKMASSKSTATSLPQPPAAFFNPLFENLLPEDVAPLSTSLQKGLAASLWQLAQDRPRGKISLRLFNPSIEKDGWHIDHTVLEIIADDMPFLVDSVTGELRRRGLVVHLVIHPVLNIERDAKGQMQKVSASKDEKTAESIMHIQLDHCPDQAVLNDIAKELRAILTENRNVVDDWPKIRTRAEEVLAELASTNDKNISTQEIQETRDFIEWLGNKNFTYLGYRLFDLNRNGKNVDLQIVPKKGLGLLRNDDFLVFDGLCDLTAQPQEVKKFFHNNRLVMIAKTNRHSRVHHAAPMDAIFIQRFDEKGQVIGEHLFVGIFSAHSYAQSTQNVPILRRKAETVLSRANLDHTSHDGRALKSILETYPRDELFQIDDDDLFDHCVGIVRLQERARLTLFTRRDPFGRFVTCLIYVPREHYNFAVRQKIQTYFEEICQGSMADQKIRLDDSALAQLLITFTTKAGTKLPPHATMESELRELCRPWSQRLRNSLIETHGEAKTLALLQRYDGAFPMAYRNVTPAFAAVTDIQAIEQVCADGQFRVDLSAPDDKGLLHLKMFRPEVPLVLSEILPLVENMGLKTNHMGGPFKVTPKGTDKTIYVHEFACNAERMLGSFAETKPLFEEAFSKIWSNENEDDDFNKLTLCASLPWRDVMMLRTLARYLRQLRLPYSQTMIATTLLTHAQITQQLVALFKTRHDPDLRGDRATLMTSLTEKLLADINLITDLEDDRIIRRYLNLIQSSLRTNYFQRTKEGAPKSYLAIKFDSRTIDFMPLPKPLVEIFVASPRLEAVHLRGGKVARGGIRWSDRREDFRNEILSLMKAQMVKNTVIVPVGSKGGFVLKQPPQDMSKMQAEGIACYRIFMSGLLDLTDNRVGNKIVSPDRVVRHDGDDPYLVVAADKGTATFSDIANGISQEYGFWLDDAFASGGSAGYDHKQMGITARGAWEAVKRRFRGLGIDIQTTDFTCVGVGDMSGDVFGNGLLLSKHTRLLGAFDHRHIFCDPTPDAAKSHAERQRLFNLPRSSWADYDSGKISKGGGVFPRTAKTIKLTPEIKKAFGITADTLSPAELMQAMLRSKVDLLYFGGIGTYVKALSETNEDVRDRTNDALRINGKEILARVIGEGANLAMTQRARVEYAQHGGCLDTDAIDNSAGVATSDHEVNIKILLRKIMGTGDLTLDARNKLLPKMTDDIAAQVLKDNYLQTQALTIMEAEAPAQLSAHAANIRMLEKVGLLNRSVEYLPDEAEIAERQRLGKGLTRSEMAVLMAYAKIWLYEELLASDLPDDEFLREELMTYFPDLLRKKYEKEITQHQLRREIIATGLTNNFVNRMGASLILSTIEQTGRSAADVVRACLLVSAAFDLPSLWSAIEGLDNKVPASVQTNMLLMINRMVEKVIPTFLTQKSGLSEKLTPAIAYYRDGAQKLSAWLLKQSADDCCAQKEKALVGEGVPSAIARQMGIVPCLAIAPNMARLATEAKSTIEEVAETFFDLGERLNLDVLRTRAEATALTDSPWQREAMAMALNELQAYQGDLTTHLTTSKSLAKKKAAGESLLAVWCAQNATALERYDALLARINATNALDLAMLTLANRELASLVKAAV